MRQNLFFFFIIEIYSFTKKISDYYSDSNGLLTTLLSIGDPAGKMRYFQTLQMPYMKQKNNEMAKSKLIDERYTKSAIVNLYYKWF